jgi:short-subunit dehydrogenase
MRGKTALVTGASRGIGLFIARALAGEGMNLIVVARSAEALEAAGAELRSHAIRVTTIAADVGRLDELEMLVARAEADSGGVDVLVNNAGLDFPYPFDKLDTTMVAQMMAVNLNAPILLTRLFLPKMIKRGRGHIVNVASLAGLLGTPYDEVYAASKHGLVGFTHSLQLTAVNEGYPVGISVICPGFISDAGMYDKNSAGSGLVAPPALKPSSPEAVAKAVVKAIREEKPELIVNVTPVRPLMMIQSLFPSVAPWLAEKTGAMGLLRGFAQQNLKEYPPR